ncbi:MAG: hypothetical protein RMM17_08035 [Acidobacteriota bacterium]|nr:hypothetical protein [Blastocatellia bacterium]MDW8412614.1 hypothetical protein [Acidobacteriota bacterium]
MFKFWFTLLFLYFSLAKVSVAQIPLTELAQRSFELTHFDGRLERCHIGLIQTQQSGKRPSIVELSAKMKGKNKAIATYKVADPDANLGDRGGISVLLYNKDIKKVTAAANGSILTFGNREIFPEDLGLNGKTEASFDFTLKGLKRLTEAVIWVSSIRDNDGNLSLAPMSAGIAGRITTSGTPPEINSVFAQLLQNGDVFGINIDGKDVDKDTTGISIAFLDDNDRMVYAFGIVGEQGLVNFAPFTLELVNNSVKGQETFRISFAVSGLKREVDTTPFKFAAVALFDASGNRSIVRLVPIQR